MAGRKLTDDEALERLRTASDALGVEPGESVPVNTALRVARGAVTMMLLGLEQALADGTDDVPGVAKPGQS